jgi:hypothetical protein
MVVCDRARQPSPPVTGLSCVRWTQAPRSRKSRSAWGCLSYLIRDRLEGSEPGARHLDSTARALEGLTDSHAFERASVALLQDLDPSLRHTGGSGDRARDGIGGLITGREDSLILMVSLDAKWSQKIRREFKRIEDNGWSPTEVWAVTNRRTTPRPRDTLIAEAKNRGWALRIFDQTWLAVVPE